MMRKKGMTAAIVAVAAGVALTVDAAAARGADAPGRDTVRSASAGTQTSPPAWTRGAVCYEVFVRSFHDSDGDGIGDLNGLTQKLDYINDGDPGSRKDLGASCIWLMPVAESPSYHGYDVRDYYRIEPDYGTAEDFHRFVAAAHRRGIRVLVDMVLNHTSSEYPRFVAALRDTASPYRSWYRFARRPPGDGKGPWGSNAWHLSPVRNEYYYGLFSRWMPDLDYHTPAVREEAEKIATFWLRDMGVDGLRLDAIQYLVEDGTCMMDCEGTHAYLREYAAHVQRVKPGAYTVGEVWDSLSELLTYYPHQLTSYFTFPLSDSLFVALNRDTVGGMLSGYVRMADALPPWRFSPLLKNHDMTRTLTALGGDVGKARLAAALLLTLPGLPFVYYGEEIGMTGDKPDPRLRTPMQWMPVPGGGFTTGRSWEPPQADSMTTNVAGEDADPGSMLNLYRRLIHLRKENEALATGTLVELSTSDPQVVAYVRRAGGDAVLVVANLGDAAVHRVSVASRGGTLPAGPYHPRSLLGGPGAAELRVGADGRIAHYVPAATISPRQFFVLDLAVASGASRGARSSQPMTAPVRRPREGGVQ